VANSYRQHPNPLLSKNRTTTYQKSPRRVSDN
jgi:hypothetical protein